MADKIVKLHYDAGVLTVEPPTIKVRKGHTIAFEMGRGPVGGQVKIEFSDPAPFSKPRFATGDPNITVNADLPTSNGYMCQLWVDGVQLKTTATHGGVIDPERGTGSREN